MQTTQHIYRAFDDELKFLANRIAGMGGHAERMVDQAVVALVNSDQALAQKVIADDVALDEGQREIDDKAIVIIAKRQPMADDLREIIAALKIGGVLERVGDYSKNIAKRVGRIEGRSRFEPLTLLPAMGELAAEMVHDVLTAYAARDPVLAREVIERDAKVDAFYDSIFRNLVSYMVENPATISSAAHLLFIARNLERVGDHATNIAEMVHYSAVGTYLPDR